MGVQAVQLSSTGFVSNSTGLGKNLSQQLPEFILIETNDLLATVLTTGYLNASKNYFQFPYNNQQMALVYTTDNGGQTQWLSVAVTGTAPNYVYSLVGTVDIATVFKASDGSAAAPSYTFTSDTTTGMYLVSSHVLGLTANGAQVANLSGTGLAVTGLISATTSITAGTSLTASNGNVTAGSVTPHAGSLISYPAASGGANDKLTFSALTTGGDFGLTVRNSAMGQSSTVSVPDPGAATANFLLSASGGTQHITTGNLQVDAGTVSSGISTGGTAGGFIAYPATASNGSFEFLPVGNAGNFNMTISPISSLSLTTVITVPDPGVATANFLLDTGTANILAEQQFVGLSNVLTFGTGTWTTTRNAEGDYSSVHSAAAETSIIGIDITPIIRAASSKGFRLDSFDVIYSIGTAAMISNAVTLDRIAYADNVAVSVTSIPLTGSLSIATQANPYVSNIAVTTPAFDVTADSKYVIEITADNDTTTAYAFYGLMLKFSQTIA
jgi:hypothetical protein